MSLQICQTEDGAEPVPLIPMAASAIPEVEALVGRLRAFLTPRNPIEEVLILQVILGARFLTELTIDPQLDDRNWASKLRLSQGMFHKNFGALERGRKPGKAEKKSARAVGLSRDEILALESSVFEPAEPTPEQIAEAAREWRAAIAVVPEITCEFPVLLKTRRVIEWYLSFYGDGLTDRQIIALDPRVDFADLAAMRACEAANLNGPFDSFCQLPSDVPIRPLADCPAHIPPPFDHRRAARAAAIGTKPQPGWE